MKPIDLSLGHPRYPWPPEAKAGAAKWVLQDHHGYPDPAGSPRLRKKIQERIHEEYGEQLDLAQVVITTGGSMGLMASLATVCQPGDTVLCPDPGFPHYRLMCEALHLRLIAYPLKEENGYLPDLQQMEELCQENTKAVIWNNPGNPIGQVYPATIIKDFMEWIENKGIYCISDEVYKDLIFNGRFESPVTVRNRNDVFTVQSFSKSFGMADLRIGYVISPPAFAEDIARFQWAYTMGVNKLSQATALGALQTSPDYHTRLRQQLRQMRDEIAGALDQWDIGFHLPDAAFYFWLDIRETGMKSIDFVEQLRQEKQILLTPGTAFGKEGEGKIRLSFADEREQVLEAVTRLGTFYQSKLD